MIVNLVEKLKYDAGELEMRELDDVGAMKGRKKEARKPVTLLFHLTRLCIALMCNSTLVRYYRYVMHLFRLNLTAN